MVDQYLETELSVEDENEEESVEINYDIASYPSDLTLSGIVQMWKDGDIVIPDYQREFVWTRKQSSLLIHSFLCGLPVPPVFFYVDENKKNLVIDGQQRILSIVFFLEGYFGKESTQGKRQVFRLSGLSEKSPYYNKRFEDLDASDQRNIKQSVLRAINVRQLDPAGESTSAYHIFERLNTGGTPLKPQEIRNCVFRGEFNKHLKTANQDTNWREILGKSYLDKHQKDIELLLRVFSLVGASSEYKKPMKEFLNRTMKEQDSGMTKKAMRFFLVFEQVTASVVQSLGEKPFHLRGPLNVSALDSVMSVLIGHHTEVDYGKLKTQYLKLKDDADFDESTRINTTDSEVVRDRIKKVEEYLLG